MTSQKEAPPKRGIKGLKPYELHAGENEVPAFATVGGLLYLVSAETKYE